jgi:catechol 2,3-dioxygenase-like lactoylglutathione lyase family enzyme
MRVEGIDHVALQVEDVARSVEWYRRVLGLERLYQDAWGDLPAVVGIGSTALALFPVPAERPGRRPARDGCGVRHIAFRADRGQFAGMRTHLTALDVPFTTEDHDISHSIYFHDPDGYEIEVTTYEIDREPGVGRL